MSDDIQLFTTQSLDNNNLPEDKKPPANDPDTIVFPEGSFSTPPQPKVASGFRAANIMTGNQTLPFRDDVEAYTKYGVPLGNFDWEEIRARNQSTAEQWGRGIAKAGVTFGTAVAENTLGFVAGLGSLAMGDSYQDNYVGRMVDNANEWMRENYANYYTREQMQSTDVFSANFWADSVLNGFAYSLASLATMYLTGGVGYVSLAGKALSAATKGRKMYNLTKAVTTGTKLANILDRGSKVSTRTLNAAKMYETGLMMALAESSVEARETRRQVVDDLKQQYVNENGGTLSDIPTDVLNNIEDLASSAGNTSFVLNLAITGGTNAFMFGAMSSGFKNSMRSLKGMYFDKNSKKVIDSFANQSPKRKMLNRSVNYLKNPGIEIVQEGSQYATNVYSSDVASQKFMDNGAIDRIQALERSLTQTFGDKEGRESMLVGGIVGSIMGLRNIKGQRAREEQEQEYRDKVRKDLQNIADGGYFDLSVEKAHRDAQATATAKKMQKALETNGLKEFKDLQAEFIQNRVVNAIENGGYDVLIEMMEDSKSLSDEEFMKHYGFPTEPDNERTIPYELGELLQIEQTKEAFVNRMIGKIENVEKVYNNVNDLFPIPALTKGLPRFAMSPEKREAEAKERQAKINLRNELFLNGYAINDKTRRMDSIMKQIEDLMSDDPILKSLGADMSALVQEIKNIEPVRFSEETPSMQQALEERESKLIAAFNALLNEVGKSNQGIAAKINPLAKDYAALSFDNAVALDRYNKLISDPYFRANFQAEAKQKEDATAEQTRKNHVDEVLSESENSADLEKNRPNAETLSESEKTALREKQKELEHEERQAKNKYQKLVEGMTDEEALKHLKTINQEGLTGPEKKGLRDAKIAVKMKIDSEEAKLAPEKEAERAARAVFKGDEQMQGEPELSEEASEIAIQGSADGREFEINGTRYVNDLENIQDAIRVGDDNTVSSVTLKDAQTKNPATFTGKPALAIAHAIYAAEVSTIESPDRDFILPETAQAVVDEMINYLKEWKEEAAFKDEESGRDRLPQSKPTQLLTEQTIELEALKSVITDSLSQLRVHLIQNANFTVEDLDADLNVKSLSKAYRSVSTLAGRRRKELNKRPDREEVQDAAVESLLSELDDVKEQFPYVLSGRTGSITNIIQKLYGKDESTETGEQTESRDPSELEGQAPRRESIDPEEYTEGQETLEVTPDQPVSTAEEVKHTEFEEPGMPNYTAEQVEFDFEGAEVIDEDEFFGTETESTEDDTEDYFNFGANTIDVKQSDIDDLLSKEKTIKIGRYTPSSRFSDRVSGENLFLEVIDALNSIASFNRTVSSEQIKQIDEVLDLFAPVLSIKTIDRITAKYEDEDANFFEVLNGLNKLKQKKLSQSTQQASEVAATPAESDPDLLNISPDIRDARNGDVAAQKRLEEYGIDWKKSTTYRFVGQSEVDVLLSNQRVKSTREIANGIDVTSSETVTTAADATHRVTFKESFDKNNGLGKVRAKNETDSNLEKGRGYDINDVQKIEVLDDNGNVVETLYDAKSTTQPTQQTSGVVATQPAQKIPAKLQEVLKNKDFIKLRNPNDDFYVNTKTGKKYTRVSKVIVKEKVERNPLLDSSSLLGNKIDKLVRDIFSGNLKDLESYNIVEPSLKSAMDELKFFVEEMQEIKAAMFEKRGEVAIAEDVILYDDENSVAGTVDLLTYDSKGVVRIYDIKTMRGNQFTEYNRKDPTTPKYFSKAYGKSNQQKHQEQLSLYRILLHNTHGLKAKDLGIMHVMLNYDEYDVTTSTVLLLPGRKHKALDNVEGIKLKDKPAAAPEESVQRPMPKAGIEGQRSSLQMMNDASFKFIDNNKYYVAVNESGELDRYAAINPETDAPYGPVSVTEGPFDKSFPLILTPNTGKLVKAKAGTKVEFILGDNEAWFSKELAEFGLDEVSKMSPEDYAFEFSNKVPIHVYLDGEFVGRLESGNPLNNVERINIVEELKAGKKVERSILKKVGTNPAYVRATLPDGTVRPVYSDPRTVLSTEPILVSVNSSREGPYLSSAGIIDGELSILNVDFSNLSLGTIFFAIDPSDTPNGEYNIIKGNTKTLTPGYIDGVMQLFKNKEMLKVADVVANTIAFPTLSPTFLHFNTFGKSGAPFIVFTSPSMGRMVRVNQDQLSSSIVNGKGKVSVVKWDDDANKFLVDRTAKIDPDYNVSEDLREFLKNKKFQVDIQAANTNEDFTDPVTGVYYDTYLDYLFNPISEFSADVLGHDSKLNIDVQRIDGSLYYDLGVTFTTEEDKTGEQEIKRAVRAVKTTKSAAKNDLLNQALGQNTGRQVTKDQDKDDCPTDPPF